MSFQSRRFYVFLIIIFQILSCSKSDPAAPPVTPPVTPPITPPVTPVVKNCQIIAEYEISGTNDTIYSVTYTYYDDGRIKGSVNKYSNASLNYAVSFSYSGNMIYRAVAAGVNSSVDTITLNSNGMITKDHEVIGAYNYITNWVYDANQQLTTFTQQQDAYPPTSASYVFTNGDNTLVSTPGFPSDTLAYDLTKPAVHGNQDEINQLLDLGAMYIKNKHLLVSSHHGATVLYSYEFNGDGNISAMTTIVNGGAPAVTSFTYQCK